MVLVHGLLDRITVEVTSMVLRNGKWFRDSIESPGFAERLESIALSLPEMSGEAFFEVDAGTPEGSLDPAFHVAQWLGPEHPSIIYHHGSNERPFDYSAASKNSFKSIFLSRRGEFTANLISLRAALHNQGMRYYVDKLGRLSNFIDMLSASVKLIDALVQYLRNECSGRIVVSGMSLGGWVTNLHRTFFNSADVYVPIFAGAALDQLFLTSYYRKLVGKLAAENPDVVRRALNFEPEFARVGDANVFPLLARHDQFVEYERQRQCYEDGAVEVIEKGHVTGALASNQIRDHILDRLRE